jgi:hypothetical protein
VGKGSRVAVHRGDVSHSLFVWRVPWIEAPQQEWPDKKFLAGAYNREPSFAVSLLLHKIVVRLAVVEVVAGRVQILGP